jgi:hypothetical protein
VIEYVPLFQDLKETAFRADVDTLIGKFGLDLFRGRYLDIQHCLQPEFLSAFQG